MKTRSCWNKWIPRLHSFSQFPFNFYGCKLEFIQSCLRATNISSISQHTAVTLIDKVICFNLQNSSWPFFKHNAIICPPLIYQSWEQFRKKRFGQFRNKIDSVNNSWNLNFTIQISYFPFFHESSTSGPIRQMIFLPVIRAHKKESNIYFILFLFLFLFLVLPLLFLTGRQSHRNAFNS